MALLVALGYLGGVLSRDWVPILFAQPPSTRFVNVGSDGPFRIWKDTRTDQCFIVTTPYFAMLSVGSC
jgi:hypothetical protein